MSSRALGRDAPPSFERDVAPILSASCWKCHGADKRRAGLDLRTLPAMLKGGDDGPVLVKGAADKSLLITQIASGTMPPGKMKLTPAQVSTIRAWIDAGAPAAKSASVEVASSADRARQHWAFRPVKKVEPPPDPSGWAHHPIDRFLAAGLRKQGLTPVGPADRPLILDAQRAVSGALWDRAAPRLPGGRKANPQPSPTPTP